jgi:hypothetical protein
VALVAVVEVDVGWDRIELGGSRHVREDFAALCNEAWIGSDAEAYAVFEPVLPSQANGPSLVREDLVEYIRHMKMSRSLALRFAPGHLGSDQKITQGGPDDSSI